MMRGVVGDSAEDGRTWQAAHDGSSGQRLRPLVVRFRGDRLACVLGRFGEPGACVRQRRDRPDLGLMRLEVNVEPVWSERAVYEPVDRLRRVGHLLRGGEDALSRREASVLLGERTGAPVEPLDRVAQFDL